MFAAQLYSVSLRTPLVMSYHTHIPEYIKSYTWRGLAEPMWMFIRAWTRTANLMLVTSAVMQTELARNACRSRKLALWRRGVDIDIFNPSFRSAAMRERLSGGHPDAPLLVHVGRLGAEKNIAVLKGAWREAAARSSSNPRADVLLANPGARLALVGDGPHRAVLEEHFAVRLRGALPAPRSCETGHTDRVHGHADRRRPLVRIRLRRRLSHAL